MSLTVQPWLQSKPNLYSSLLTTLAQSLTPSDESDPELVRCAADVAYFINEYVWIDDAQDHGDGVGIMPFHLWDAQRDLLGSMATERLLLILKARQLGISWLCCVYALWLCLFHPGRAVLLFSKGQDEANELLRRVTVMYERLPESLRAALPALIKHNTRELGWANGSWIRSLPATQSSGRTFTASLVILDEAAYLLWAREIYTALKPTIDGGGKLIILSTANGMGNLFHELCDRASKGLGRFVFRFLPWQARPDRDDQWYTATAEDAVQSSLMEQEYPATPEDAFRNSGTERFLPSITLWDACKEDLPPLTPYEPMVLALDGAVSGDTFAVVGITRHPSDDTRFAIRHVAAYEPRGEKLVFDTIETDIFRLIDNFNIVQVCFDEYQLHQMGQHLSTRVWAEPFSQGVDRLIADRLLLDSVIGRQLAHDGNTLLRQHLDNADRKIEGGEDGKKLRIVKRTQGLKIDIAVCASMALYRAQDFQ